MRILRWLVTCAAVLLSACATLPDMAPYRDATVQLRSAVVASGNAVGTELNHAAASVDAKDTGKKLEADGRTFDESWKLRVAGADALVTYSQALAQLAKAGTEGSDAARSLAAALAQLAGSVGIAPTATGAAATATDAAALVYAQVAAVRASRSLAEALVAAQPAVDNIAAKLGADLDASLAIVRAAYGLQRTALADRYNDEAAYLVSLGAERRKLYAKGTLTHADEQRLKELAALYDSTRSWREPMQAAFADLDERYKVEREVIAATKAALLEWAATHRELAGAVRDGGTVNVEGLLQAVLETRELVRKLRAL